MGIAASWTQGAAILGKWPPLTGGSLCGGGRQPPVSSAISAGTRSGLHRQCHFLHFFIETNVDLERGIFKALSFFSFSPLFEGIPKPAG